MRKHWWIEQDGRLPVNLSRSLKFTMILYQGNAVGQKNVPSFAGAKGLFACANGDGAEVVSAGLRRLG
jgi:hypothetical protein